MTQPWLPFAAGEQRKVDLSQWYTPPKLAARIWDWSGATDSHSLLEPSAGRGSLIEPGRSCPHWTAYDVDPTNVAHLQDRFPLVDIHLGDYLASDIGPRFEMCIMNPPYENDLDAKFILRALEHCDVVIALIRATMDHSNGRWNDFWRHVRCTHKVHLVQRPVFGGAHKPMTDFKVMRFEGGIRARPRRGGEQSAVIEEYWPESWAA